MVLKLLIMGEASSRLQEATRVRAPEVPWRDIIGMRNVLIHEYDVVDVDIVWKALTEDLPRLRESIEHLLDRGTD